ncbi:MAG: deoxyribose-phosphate aldolase [Sphingobacteriales bacterium]|nr:MAG: deoxyribose-phosphate aldolase [Sphingobacteriales bacterium]
MYIAKYIDHTLLKATATTKDIEQLCFEAIKHHFYAVCINPCYISLCKNILTNSNVNIATVVGFPLGAMQAKSKLYEAEQAIHTGANEIDMVLNIGFLKSNLYQEVEDEITTIKKSIGEHTLKVIIETCYLTREEKITATRIVLNSGADFIKTSTGFGTGGATFEDILLFKEIAGNNLKIKASGGIKDAETAMKYISLGVSRIGTSSGVDIVQGKISNSNY